MVGVTRSHGHKAGRWDSSSVHLCRHDLKRRLRETASAYRRMGTRQFDVNGMLCEGAWAVPDPASFMTTRNCTLYSNFVVSVLRNAYKSGDAIDDGKICQASPLEAYLFVTESLEHVLRPSMCQFAQWYYNDKGPFCGNSYKTANDTKYLARLFSDPLETCRQDVKASIGMGINLDIAGIGVC